MMIPTLSGTWLVLAEICNRIKMEVQLEKTSLQIIEVSTSDVIWVEQHKEVLIGGKLFDVKSYTQANNKLKLTGLYDSAEDEIATLLNKLEKSGSEEDSIPASFLLQALSPAEVAQNQFKTGFQPILIKATFAEYLFINYHNPILGINTPPPNA